MGLPTVRGQRRSSLDSLPPQNDVLELLACRNFKQKEASRHAAEIAKGFTTFCSFGQDMADSIAGYAFNLELTPSNSNR